MSKHSQSETEIQEIERRAAMSASAANTGTVTTQIQPSPPSISQQGTDGDDAWRTFVAELQAFYGLTRDQVGCMMGATNSNQMASIMKGRQRFSEAHRQALYDNLRAMEGFLLRRRGQFRSKQSLFQILVDLFTFGATPHMPPSSSAFQLETTIPLGFESAFVDSVLPMQFDQMTTPQKRRENAFLDQTYDGLLVILGSQAIDAGDAAPNDPEPWRGYFDALLDTVDPAFLDEPEMCNRLALTVFNSGRGFDHLVEEFVGEFGAM